MRWNAINYHFLVFHENFTCLPERMLFQCASHTIDKIYHLYWQFLSCAMFLFRGGDKYCQTNVELVESTDRVIIAHRLNFDKDVEVLAKLCEGVIGPSSCSPNLHSRYHMIRKLIELKGHSTFEMIAERLVSDPMRMLFSFCYCCCGYCFLCCCFSCCFGCYFFLLFLRLLLLRLMLLFLLMLMLLYFW